MNVLRGMAYTVMGTVCGLLGISFALDLIPSWVSALGPTAFYFIGMYER